MSKITEMNRLKKTLLLLVIVFAIAQFFGPEKNQGDIATKDDFIAETHPSNEVKLILEQACYDCHSDVTRYPWYNNITPVNYWMAHHVNEGKDELNFSKWSSYSVKRKDHKLEEIIEMVEEKEMPLPSYTWIHTDAKLLDSQIKVVKDWAEKVRLGYNFLPKPE